jgi:hypothetical protein
MAISSRRIISLAFGGCSPAIFSWHAGQYSGEPPLIVVSQSGVLHFIFVCRYSPLNNSMQAMASVACTSAFAVHGLDSPSLMSAFGGTSAAWFKGGDAAIVDGCVLRFSVGGIPF